MVLGILSIVPPFFYIGVLLGPLAIGFYASARAELKQMPPIRKGNGMAIAGLVMGIIGTLVGLLILAAIITVVCVVEEERRRHGF